MLHTFADFYGNRVEFTFGSEMIDDVIEHVFVICQFDNQWLLTIHRERGIEFPGGKVEKGESLFQAAVREVYEETGGVVAHLKRIATYRVYRNTDYLTKAVFFAEISAIKTIDFLETKGYILLKALPNDLLQQKAYSFIMKDQMVSLVLSKLGGEEMGMPLELNTLIVTNSNEVRISENLFSLKKSGYRLYPLDVPMQVQKTLQTEISGEAMIRKLEWEKGETVLTYELINLHSSN